MKFGWQELTPFPIKTTNFSLLISATTFLTTVPQFLSSLHNPEFDLVPMQKITAG